MVIHFASAGSDGDSLTALGSGAGLSVLISLDGARVLIVSGDDPAEFANALSRAVGRLGERIDLVVSTPGAEKVAARAVDLASPRQLLTIDDPDTDASAINWGVPATTISAVTSIAIGNQAALEIDPGRSVDALNVGWSARIRGAMRAVLIAERAPAIQLNDVDAFIIAGTKPGPLFSQAGLQLLSSAAATDSTSVATTIEPGQIMRLPLDR